MQSSAHGIGPNPKLGSNPSLTAPVFRPNHANTRAHAVTAARSERSTNGPTWFYREFLSGLVTRLRGAEMPNLIAYSARRASSVHMKLSIVANCTVSIGRRFHKRSH